MTTPQCPIYPGRHRLSALTAILRSAVPGLFSVLLASFSRTSRAVALCVGGYLLVFAPVHAAPVKFDIPAQPAPSALQLFIKQSGNQVMFVADEVKAVTTKAVTGEHEPAAALALLLDGTGYTSTERKAGWFAVVRVVAERPGSIEGYVRAADSGRAVAGARVEIAGTDKFVLTDKRGRFTFDEAPTGDQELHITAEGMQNTKVTDVTVKPGHRHTISAINIPAQPVGVVKLDTFVVSAKKNDGVVELDPYSVEGRKEKPFTTNMDIPRTINDAQPYYIFDAKAIDQSGATNVEDFLKQRLTMNTAAQTNGEISGFNQMGNTSSINLRGLGGDKTLILVNGRRMAGVAAPFGTDSFQPDLNGIPMSAIDRVEVLPSSASGIYGGSAIGGVVNVILKKGYQGGEIRANYDNVWDTDSPRRALSLNYGLALEGGRTNVSFNASWSDAKPLVLQDRVQLFKDNIASIQSRSPDFFYSSMNPWLGVLPNITPNASGATTLILKNNGNPIILNSRNTYIPSDTSPTISTAELAAGLLANAGRWNMDFPESTQSPTGLLRPFGSTPETRSFSAHIRRQMLPRVDVFAELSYNENRTDSIYHPVTSYLAVPINAPNNPFTTAVRVRVPDATQIPITTNSQSRSATVGAVAQLPWNWTGALDYTWSENYFQNLSYNMDTQGRNAALLSGALNPFVDTLRYPLDFAKYLRSASYAGASRLHDLALRGSGPLPVLPWGTPTLTVGLERRMDQTPERIQQEDYPISVASNLLRTYYARESTTNSGYAEATVPLLKSAWLPGVHTLDLQLSGRSERYEVDTGTPAEYTFYNRTPPATGYDDPTLNGQPYFAKTSYHSSNYTAGLKYQPIKELTLRVSRATAFLPPTPAQLLTNPEASAVILELDPVTGRRDQSIDMISGGNPNLKPQNSKSLNAGVIWEPSWKPLQGLRLDAEYYKIEQFDAIDSLRVQTIVNQESVYRDRVKRDSNGQITLVDNSAVNLYHRETEGWDLSADYTFKTAVGTFNLRATESIIMHLKTQYAQTQPAYDAAGYHPIDGGGVTKYKTSVALSWEWRRWTAGWNTRHFSSYKQYGAAGGPNSIQYTNGDVYTTTYLTAQGSDTISSQAYHDAFIGYAFGKRQSTPGSRVSLATLQTSVLSDLTVQFGVRNVFDKVAPLDVYYASNYYFSPYGDPRLRSYWLSVRKAF